MENLHSLLRRQLRHVFGTAGAYPDEVLPLLSPVNEAYHQFDGDRLMLERTLELTSQELIQANSEMRDTLSLLRSTLESTADGILVVDLEGRIRSFNQRFVELWRIPEDILDRRDDDAAIAYVLDQLANPHQFVSKVRELYADSIAESFDTLEFKDGRVFERYSKPRVVDGKPAGRVWSFRDVTARHRAEETIRYMAYHDSLTALPNRELFKDRLTMAINNAKRSGFHVGVIFLDLDRFKNVNDTLGHAGGDEFLVAVARLVTENVRDGDTIARIGGDEFAILQPHLESVDDAMTAGQRILHSFRNPLSLSESQFHCSASLGLATYPADGDTADELLSNADIAMYRAKEMGRNNLQPYTEVLIRQLHRRVTLESQLRNALRCEEFELFYQPVASIPTNRIIGVEALLRWRSPRGLVSPGEFIPLAEDTGLIVPIGEWVLRAACLQMVAWQRVHPASMRLAVNLSPRQFLQADLLRMIDTILAETGLSPQSLELEITESLAMQNPEVTARVLRSLRDMGVGVAIDDFGTGYSSLSYLKHFPIRTLKIDRSFVRDIPDDLNDAAIAAATIALAHNLHLSVVAEGVETHLQLEFLRRSRCDEYQGYFIAPPMQVADVERVLAAEAVVTREAVLAAPTFA